MLAEAGIESVKLPPRSPNLRLRRALRENHKGRLFGSNDFLWRRFVAERRPRIYGALSPGTKSSRTRKPAHHSDRDECRHCRRHRASAKAWRTAQLLLPGNGIT